MPIYEFYCSDCNTIFSFFSRGINTTKRPLCPKCKKHKLERQISAFAMTGKAKEGGDGGMDDLPFDEGKMEKAVTALASEAESIKDDDPRRAADLMRKFTKMTGMELGKGMTEALNRMESGEDPEAIEKEMGDLLEKEDPFMMPDKKGAKGKKNRPPSRDETLYEL